jgi:hypothetical protein
MALVDEAWKVPRVVVDGGLRPTLAEAVQPQLWLVSTAGTSASDLMAAYRAQGAAGTGGVFLAEWSAPEEDVDVADPAVWRAAAPFWDERRQQRVAEAFETADEWTFRQQWLNQWVPRTGAPLIDADAWARLSVAGAALPPTGRMRRSWPAAAVTWSWWSAATGWRGCCRGWSG